MPELKKYKLEFIREEQHLMLPTFSSIKLTQNLYDTLFQYVITEEKEELLKKFISLLESHIKRKDNTPFSLPISELEFIDEGLEELRLLNWIEIPVAVFQLSIDADINDDNYQEELDKVLTQMERLMIFSRPSEDNMVWVYPFVLVR